MRLAKYTDTFALYGRYSNPIVNGNWTRFGQVHILRVGISNEKVSNKKKIKYYSKLHHMVYQTWRNNIYLTEY